MKPVRTWVLIADGSRARIVENLGPGKGLHEVEGLTFAAELPANRDLTADRPGRVFESASAARHAVENTDFHRQLKQDFARRLAEALDGALAQSRFDRCILVAPPEMMGEMRRVLSEQVREKVGGELVLDLTKIPDDRLAAHLGSVLPV